MSKFRFYVLIFGCLLYKSIYCQKVDISGKCPAYSGKTLDIYTYTDEITYMEESLGSIEIDDSGAFSIQININEIRKIFIPLGIYKGYMYIEPNISYDIVLPPYQAKELKDELNPYFEEIEIQIGVLNSWKDFDLYDDELNQLIGAFDYLYNSTLNDLIYQKYGYKYKNTDTIIERLSEKFETTTNEFFEDYKKYKIGYLYFLNKVNKEKVIEKYFRNNLILYNNPAYHLLFHEVFNKFIYELANDFNKKNEISNAFQKRDYTALVTKLNYKSVDISDTLKELIFLKEIHDGLYSGEYPRQPLIQLIDSLFFSTTIPEHKYIAQNIRLKITRLLPGFSPPDFNLIGDDSSFYSLDSFKGKYLYLTFANTQSLACIKEFSLLNELQEKYKDILQIVTISVDNTFENALFYKERKNLDWKFLHYGNNSKILSKFEIKAYPTYFLIDPEGKLVFSPAPSPYEDFEIKFFMLLKSNNILLN